MQAKTLVLPERNEVSYQKSTLTVDLRFWQDVHLAVWDRKLRTIIIPTYPHFTATCLLDCHPNKNRNVIEPLIDHCALTALSIIAEYTTHTISSIPYLLEIMYKTSMQIYLKNLYFMTASKNSVFA